MSTAGNEPAGVASAASPSFELADRDAVAWLNSLPAESADLAITDPPYESLEKHRAIGTTTRLKHVILQNDWFRIFPNARFPELFSACYACGEELAIYLFCDQETMFVAKPFAKRPAPIWSHRVGQSKGPEPPCGRKRGHQADDWKRATSRNAGWRMVQVLATRKTSAPA